MLKVKSKKGLKVLNHLGQQITGTIKVPCNTFYNRLVKAGDLVLVTTTKKEKNGA